MRGSFEGSQGESEVGSIKGREQTVDYIP